MTKTFYDLFGHIYMSPDSHTKEVHFIRGGRDNVQEKEYLRKRPEGKITQIWGVDI